jgi:sugar phosphate isomerase/epimerase
MLRLASHTFGFIWQDDAEATFERIAQVGISRIQLMASPPHFDPWERDPKRTRRLREVIERHGLEVLAGDLSSSDVNLASPSQDARNFAVESYSRLIERCAELGARWVCVGSGRRNAILNGANLHLMPFFRGAFDRVIERAKALGVTTLLENQPQGMLAHAETIADFLADYTSGEVQLAYDVANAYAVKEEPVDGLSLIGSHLGVVHLSDSPKGIWRHDPIGAGTIDFSGVRETLTEIGFDGPIVLEILSDTPLAALCESRDRLIAEGWRFDG